MLTTSKTSFVLLARPRLWIIVNYIETAPLTILYSISMCRFGQVSQWLLSFVASLNLASSEQDADEVSIEIFELNLFILTSLNIYVVKLLYLLYFTTLPLFSHLMKIRTIFHCIDQLRPLMSDTNWRSYMGPRAISLCAARPFSPAPSHSRVSVRSVSHLWRRVLRTVPPFLVLATYMDGQILRLNFSLFGKESTYQEPPVLFSGPSIQHIFISVLLGASKVDFLPSFRFQWLLEEGSDIWIHWRY